MLEPLSPMTQSSLLSFAELFSFMMSEGRARQQQLNNNLNFNDNNNANHVNNTNDNDNEPRQPQQPQQANLSVRPPQQQQPQPPVNFCDIMTVFEKAVREVQSGQQAIRAKARAPVNQQVRM